MEGSLAVIRSDGRDPAGDLLAEEALLRDPGDDPTLLLYSWARPVLVLGQGQDAAGVDLSACRDRGVPVLRRVSGGTGVVHDRDVAASLVLPATHPWARTIPGLYRAFLEPVVAALAGLGVPVDLPPPPVPGIRPPRSPICFEAQDQETLRVDGRKAVGCAQARRRRAVLCHATLVCHLDPALQAAVYGVPEARVRAAIAPLPLAPEAFQALPDLLVRAFADALGRVPRDVPRPAVPEDVAARYRDPHWAPGSAAANGR